MNQSSVIAGSLLLAYVIFVITKGELPCYLQLLGIATDALCPAGQSVAALGTTTTPTAPAKNPVLGFGGSGSPLGPIQVGIGVGGGGVGIGVGIPGIGVGI